MCTGVTPQSTNSMKALASLSAAAAFLVPGFLGSSARAADYCMTTTDGNRLCIHGTYGPRGRRRMVISQNGGYAKSYIYDCYNDNYGRTSIVAYGCWAYTAISSEPDNLPEVADEADSVRGILASDGFMPKGDAIDLEKVKNAMPPEMK